MKHLIAASLVTLLTCYLASFPASAQQAPTVRLPALVEGGNLLSANRSTGDRMFIDIKGGVIARAIKLDKNEVKTSLKLGEQCGAGTQQVCYENNAGKRSCFCYVGALKGQPMTLVNNTNSCC